MNFELLPAYDHPDEVAALFSEYTDLLIAGDPAFRHYLDLQDYEGELAHLEVKYGPPHGRLYLARCDGQTAGCIGLRRLDEGRCEMKRLYVRPAFRNRGLGGQLVRQIIADAKEMGCSTVLLDTYPFLERAVQMYERYGFRRIPRYNDNPISSMIYLELNL